MVSVVGKTLERLQGLVSGDGVKDSAIYFEDHGVVVDALGTGAGSPAFRVRALDPRTNAPTEVFRIDKDGAYGPAAGMLFRVTGNVASITTRAVGAIPEPTSLAFGSALGTLMAFDTALGTSLFKYPVQVVVTTPNDTLRLQNDGSTSTGVLIGCLHNKAVPALNDAILRISGRGNDSNGNDTSYGYMTVFLADPTDGSEDAYFQFTCQVGGSATDVLQINGATGSVFGKGGLSVADGNFGLSGTAQRITGDFSNATRTNRVIFQTSTANGNTNLGVMPLGSGNTSSMDFYGGTDPLNCSLLTLSMATPDVVINAGKTGSGTQGSMALRIGGNTKISLGSAGEIGFFGAGGGTKPTVTGSRGANAALASLLTALAGLGLLTDSSS